MNGGQHTNQLRDALAAFDHSRATLAYQTLLNSLRTFGAEEIANTLGNLREGREQHIALLRKHPLQCNAIMDISNLAIEVADGRVPANDIAVSHDVAALIYSLTLSYEAHGAPSEYLEALDAAYASLFRRFLEAASPQITTLCKFVLRIGDYLSTLALAQSRILLVELPVGNSLPISILKNILEPLAKVELIQVSLSRNDRTRAGITREELLAERLRSIMPAATDIALYLDEWNTGSNFNSLCKLQTRILRKARTFFFPCAMLSHGAPSYARYQTFCAEHERYFRTWGRAGAEFRQSFPPLVSALSLDGEFFWSEKDRLSGWRKMQLHGSMFSSIDAALGILTENSERLDEALQLVLLQIVSSQTLPFSAAEGLTTLREMFLESCQAYRQRHDELLRCADDLAAGGVVYDFDAAVEDVHHSYRKARFGEGDEKVAMMVALMFMNRMGSFEPTDRYYFKTHAPIIAPLQGRMKRPHELTLEYINRRMKEI